MRFLSALLGSLGSLVIGGLVLAITAIGAALFIFSSIPEWGRNWLAEYGQSIGYEISYDNLNLSLFEVKAEVTGFRILELQNKAPLLTLEKGLVNLNLIGHLTKNLDITEVELNAPAVHLTRGGGQWNWQEFIGAVKKKAAEKPKDESSKPFEFLVEQLEMKKGSIHIQDSKKSFKHEFTDLNLQLKNLTNLNAKGDISGIRSGFGFQMGELNLPDPKTKKEIPLGKVAISGNLDADESHHLLLDLLADIDQGKISTKTKLNSQSGEIDGDVQFSDLSLIPAIAMLPTTTPLHSKSGALSGKLKIHGSNKGVVTVAGDMNISKLSVFEPDNKSELLAWNHADIIGFEFTQKDQGQRLAMNEILVSDPKGRLTIFEDKTTNFRKLFVKSDSKSPTQKKADSTQKEIESPQKESAPSKSIELPTGNIFPQKTNPYIRLAAAKRKNEDLSLTTPKQVEKKKAFDLEIKSIGLKNASIDFTDFSIKPKFQTKIHDFHGTLLGLSNQPNRYASMAFDGKVDKTGLVQLRGQVDFSDPRRNNDITLAFKRIPLKSINPYATTFAGYEIKGGTISVMLDYKIKDADLKGDNRIVINQIQLGDEVPDYKGKSLPLKLAVALLEDGDGIIDLNIPVSGNIDKPEFSTGHVVWQAITTVITNIVAAPFRAIGNLLGIDNFKGIFFDPGEGALSLAEKDKVEHLATALKKRVKAKLILNGAYDPVEDAANLSRARIDRDIFKMAGFKLGGDEPLPKLSIGDERIQKAIGALYVQKAGRLKSLQRQITGPGGVEKWQAMREEMITAEPVTEHQLQLLAKHRAAVVKRAITEIDPSLSSRVEIGEVKEGKATPDGISLEIDFGTVE